MAFRLSLRYNATARDAHAHARPSASLARAPVLLTM
jgi:hypothetical protein